MSTAPTSLLSMWRRRDLRLAVLARAVSVLGDELAVVALTLRVHDAGSGPGTVAALFAANLMPIVLLAPLVGIAVDRLGSRFLLVTSGLVPAVACVLLARATQTPELLLEVAVLGAGQAINNSTWQALIPSLVPEEDLATAIGFSASATTFAAMFAPALAGLLVSVSGTGIPLLLDAASFVVVTAAGVALRQQRRTAEDHQRGAWRGLRFLREDAVAGAALAALCCFIVVGMTINIAEVFLVRDVLHAGAGWYGAVGTIYALGLLAGSSLTGRLARRWQSLRLVAPALAITAAACGGYALVPQVAWLIPLALAGGGANGVLNVCVGALVVGRSPEQLRGRVSAAMNAAISAATVLGLGAGAATTGVAAPRVAIGLSAAAAAVIAVVVGALIKRAHANGP